MRKLLDSTILYFILFFIFNFRTDAQIYAIKTNRLIDGKNNDVYISAVQNKSNY